MEQSSDKNIRMTEDQKSVIYNYLNFLENEDFINVRMELFTFLKRWRVIVQNAQQSNQLRRLFETKLKTDYDMFISNEPKNVIQALMKLHELSFGKKMDEMDY